MKNKIIENLRQEFPDMSEEDLLLVSEMLMADEVYETVLDDIEFQDQMERSMTKGMLKRQTRKHLMYEVLNSASESQLGHLKEYMRQAKVLVPFIGYKDAIVKFAEMYPDLQEKILAGMEKFFEKFVANFKRFQ